MTEKCVKCGHEGWFNPRLDRMVHKFSNADICSGDDPDVLGNCPCEEFKPSKGCGKIFTDKNTKMSWNCGDIANGIKLCPECLGDAKRRNSE